MSEAPKVTFIHNPNSPDIFADSASGFFLMNGNVRVTLESLRCNHSTEPGPLDRVVVGRLVMPLTAVETLAKSLLDFLEKQRAQQKPSAQGVPTLQ